MELVETHEQPAVADQRDDGFVGFGDLRADRGRESTAHRGPRTVVDVLAVVVGLEGHRGPKSKPARIAGRDGVSRERLPEGSEHARGGEGRFVDRERGDPVGLRRTDRARAFGPRSPGISLFRVPGIGSQLLGERRERLLRVGEQGDRGLVARAEVARVHRDVDEFVGEVVRPVLGGDGVEVGTDRERGVRLLETLGQRRARPARHDVGVEVVVLGDHALRFVGRGDGRVERLRDRQKFVGRLGGANPVAADHDGVRGRTEAVGDVLDRRRADPRRVGRFVRADLGLRGLHS